MTGEQIAALLLKLTLLWGSALLITAALRRASAALRHLVLACAIAASLGLPALTWIIPEWRVATTQPTVQADPTPAPLPAPRPRRTTPRSTPDPAMVVHVPAPAAAVKPPTPSKPIPWAALMLGVWLAGVAVSSMRLFAGLWHLRRLRLAARPLHLPDQQRRGIELLEGSSEAMPLTWGWRKPRILLPAGFTEWSAERVQLVLAHEIAHIQRRDWPVQILGEITRVVYWFHPLAWITLARLREESERAADDRVLNAGYDGSGYGLHLIEIARLCRTPLGVSAATLAMATPASFEQRLTALVNPILDRSPLSARQTVWSAAALAALLLPLAAVTWGQVRYEIRGRVVDANTGQGIEGVTIQIGKAPAVSGNAKDRQPGVVRAETVGEVKTDAQGRFRIGDLSLGEHLVQARKDGYGSAKGQEGGPTLAIRFATLTEDKPSAEIEMTMVGGGSVTGQLIDADTGEPAVGVRVAAELIRNLLGARTTNTQSRNSARTDAEGRFTIANVPAGEYVLAAEPFGTDPERWVENFTEEDLSVVETGYEPRFFPAGPAIADVLPIPVTTGTRVNAGTFRVKRINLYRVRIGLPQPDCPEGATFRLRISPSAAAYNSSPSAIKEVACGQASLARGLPEGIYSIAGQTVAPGPIGVSPDSVFAVESVQIRDERTKIDLHPRKGYLLEGTVVLAEGAGNLNITGARVSLMFADTVPIFRGLTIFRVDAQRNFSMPNLYPGTASVRMTMLPAGAYVRQVRYNGIAQPDMRFDFTGQGKLEVIVDTGAGSINGLVTQRDAAVAGGRVSFVKWPMIAGDRLQSLDEVTAKPDGRFQTHLPPGEYRVFALTEAQYGRMGEPGMLERLAAGGQRLTIERNSSHNLTLNVADPSR